jgi:recombination protein RecR
MNFSSKLLEDAVKALSTLPGVGKKTALRLALHLINQPDDHVEYFSRAILNMRKEIKHCKICFNLSDDAICSICNDHSRNRKLICVVESVRDVMAIEDTNQYRGTYHILGGIISPLEGIGPSALNIDGLINRVANEEVEEIIMAISPTIEGETTLFYISRQLQSYKVKITTIARGVAFGGELEYADELTLGRSIISRVPYSSISEE